jgi:hypothetical protein
MTIQNITEITIYESPDGGRTVYARNPGSNHRTLHSISKDEEKRLAALRQQERWQFILGARETNPAIDELCKQIEVIYELSRTPQ